MRKYTALQDGKVVERGTFKDVQLLKKDYPEDQYVLLLDQYLEFEEKVLTYVDYRKAAYPPLQEFADATYWQSQGDTSKMEAYLAKCEEVKLKYPKPELV